MNEMKILNIANNYFGTTVYTELGKRQGDLAITPVFVIFLPKGEKINRHLAKNIYVLFESRLLKLMFAFFPQLRYIYHKHELLSITANEEINLVHSHTLHSNGAVGHYISKTLKLVHVISVRNVDINVAIPLLPYLRLFHRAILKNALIVTAPNPRYAATIRNIFKVKSVLLSNPIDKFWEGVAITSNKPACRKLTAIVVGEVCKNKNQIAVARALNILNVPAKLIVVGRITEKRYFKKLMRLNKAVEVDYRGEIQDKELLANTYLEADVKCLVSHTETFGLALVEAALLGVPVVYTGGQAIDGYRNDGIWGYAADSRNPASIARAIKNCLELSAEDIRTAARVEFGAATYIQRLGEIYGVSAHSGKSNG